MSLNDKCIDGIFTSIFFGSSVLRQMTKKRNLNQEKRRETQKKNSLKDTKKVNVKSVRIKMAKWNVFFNAFARVLFIVVNREKFCAGVIFTVVLFLSFFAPFVDRRNV